MITGAQGGLGRALCQLFKEAGYWVIATDNVSDKEALGDVYVRADLLLLTRDVVYREEIIGRLTSLTKPHGLDALVNNAAVQILGRVDNLLVEDWQKTIDINVTAPLILIQKFLPHIEKVKGSVVNIASIHGRLTKAGFLSYATSKSALIGMTRALAVDLGPRVRVNAVSPAATETPMLMAGFNGSREKLQHLASMHPLGRIATAEEVARVALFLTSEAARFMTGVVIPVDGGIGSRLHDPD